MHRNQRREGRSDRAAYLTAHIHGASGHSGVLAGNVCSHRPITALREIQSAGATGEDEAGSLRTLRLRSYEEKHGGGSKRTCRKKAAADARSGNRSEEHTSELQS